jgi:hypothetical protein
MHWGPGDWGANGGGQVEETLTWGEGVTGVALFLVFLRRRLGPHRIAPRADGSSLFTAAGGLRIRLPATPPQLHSLIYPPPPLSAPVRWSASGR